METNILQVGVAEPIRANLYSGMGQGNRYMLSSACTTSVIIMATWSEEHNILAYNAFVRILNQSELL